MEKAQLHALHGDQLIQSDHYALDSIRPKCLELRRVCDNFSNEARKKNDLLAKSLEIHAGVSKVSWHQAGRVCSLLSGAQWWTEGRPEPLPPGWAGGLLAVTC